jgi:hypothetical protein
MPRPPRRERLLITRDGWVLIQEDPSEHTVPVVVLEVGDTVVRFFFESTVLVPATEAAERPLLVSTYLEEDETAEGGGNGDDPLEDR